MEGDEARARRRARRPGVIGTTPEWYDVTRAGEMTDGRYRGVRIGAVGAALALLLTISVTPPPGAANKPGTALCGGLNADKLADPKGAVARAGPRGEAIRGSRGNDRLLGGGGGDRLCGGRGLDRLRGRGGRDRISGGRQSDRIKGGRDRDRLHGGPGRDRIGASDGDHDTVGAGPGADFVVSRDGVRDRVRCGPGFDIAEIDAEDKVRGCTVANDGSTPGFALPNWPDGIWSTPDKYSTIQTGDINGDGVDELIGRGPLGIEAYEFDTDKGQWMPLYAGGDPALADGGIWEQPQYYETIQLGDVNGDGADELLAREVDGLHVWHYDPGSATWSELPTLTDLSDANDWGTSPSLYETIQTGNLVGGAQEEVFGRTTSGVVVWQLTGSQWERLVGFTDPEQPFDFADQPEYYTTIHSADIVDGGHEELWGRAPDGVRFYQLTQQGGQDMWSFLSDATLTHFSDANGWGNASAYTTLTTGKITADGTTFVVGRDSGGTYAEALQLPWEGKPFLSDAFDDASGFGQAQYYSTFQTADLDGDGVEEVLARNKDGIWAVDIGDVKKVQLTPVKGDANGHFTFSDTDGWSDARYDETIQTAHIGSTQGRVLIARGATGVQTARLDLTAGSWASLSAQFPSFEDDPGTQAAYAAINEALAANNKQWTDLRQEYATASLANLMAWEHAINDMNTPLDVPQQAWDEVKGQLLKEINGMESVATWFEESVHDQITDCFVLDQSNASSVFAQSAMTLDAGSADASATLILGLGVIFSEIAEAIGPENEEAGAILYLLGNALSSGLGPGGVDSASAAITAQVATLEGDMGALFQAALNGNQLAEGTVFGDYGLQLAAEELLTNGMWTADLPAKAQAASQQAFTVWAWQQISPVIWGAYHDDFSDTSDDYCPSRNSCYYVAGSASRHFDPKLGETYYTPGADLKSAVKTQLFSAVSDDCQTTWNAASCNLAVAKPDLFGNLNGWKLPRWECDVEPGRQDPYRCQPG